MNQPVQELFQAWDRLHDAAKHKVLDYLGRKELYEADFVKLARWCLFPTVNPSEFMPTGEAGCIRNGVDTADFLGRLHHAMIDDGEMCFALSDTGPCFEFCSPHELSLLPQWPDKGYRKRYEWKDWSVEEFISQVQKHHETQKHLRTERLARHQAFQARLSGWIARQEEPCVEKTPVPSQADAQREAMLDKILDVQGIQVLAILVSCTSTQALRDLLGPLLETLERTVIVLAAAKGSEALLVAGVTKDLIPKFRAVELVNFVAAQVGGKGGGRDDVALAGGTHPERLPAALGSVPGWVADQLEA